MGKKKVKTVKNQNEHVSVKYQTTRRINIGKHISHITKKKKNKICIDCKKMEVEECWLCGKEEHACEMALPNTQVDYEWLWVCLECHEIVTDSVALINLREAVKNEKEKRKIKEPTFPCKECSHIIYKNRRAIKCVECQIWLHLKCAGLKDHAEAKAVEDIFKCKKCNESTDREKIILGYKGISLRKSDIESLGPGRWLNDTIISFGVQNLLSEYDCGTTKTKLVDPTITQLLKNYCRKDYVKIVFDDMGLADADWILFIVNNHDNDLMDSARRGAGGSHYSLLVYSKKQKTFFDLDPLCFTNGPSVKKLYENIKDFMTDGAIM